LARSFVAFLDSASVSFLTLKPKLIESEFRLFIDNLRDCDISPSFLVKIGSGRMLGELILMIDGRRRIGVVPNGSGGICRPSLNFGVA
jgi:hypothetical protein